MGIKTSLAITFLLIFQMELRTRNINNCKEDGQTDLS